MAKPVVEEKKKDVKRKKNTTPHTFKKTGQKARDKQRRKEEAISRQLAWQALTPEQQLQSLDARGLTAKKQRAKLA